MGKKQDDGESILIGGNCYIVRIHDEVYVEYTERSPDHWYSDTETEHDIDAVTAARIVETFRRAGLIDFD